MIALGCLLCLYALASWFWPIMGKQLILLLWMQQLAPAAQWSIRGALLGAGVALIVWGARRRRRPE